MNVAHSVKWEDKRRWYPVLLLLVVMMIASLLGPVAAGQGDSPLVQVIVEKAAGASGVEGYVEQLGGSVLFELPIINGFAAEVPASAMAVLEVSPNVAAVTPDGSVELMGKPPKDDGGDTSDPAPTGEGTVSFGDTRYAATLDGSMYHINAEAIKSVAAWPKNAGQGVTVALIDSGVVPVDGLTLPGKVINGPDLSFESQDPDLMYLDTFGHGTHMAGIIAGNTSDSVPTSEDTRHFYGVAPGASILSIKVADYQGSTDVSQVIAAIDWVVQHRNDNGMNVRVINLSFGTNSDQTYLLDPLAHAVEQAVWRGIVVVVAAGNDGNVEPLRNPALDPYVIAVGAANTNGTPLSSDDTVPEFSNCGRADRHVDLVAPGVSIVSLRNPGSYADTNYPSARVGEFFFRGTGTSQAAAVVSGAAAVLLSIDPGLSALQVKELLTSTAQPIDGTHAWCQGAGLVDLQAASKVKKAPRASYDHLPSIGTGSLDAARGSFHLEGPDGVALEGEQDIFGQPFDSNQHAIDAALGQAWIDGTWNGSEWTGLSWSGLSWSGVSWSGVSWSGLSWSGLSWSGLSWSDMTWNGLSWSGLSWSGLSWSGLSWSASIWSGVSWDSPVPRYN